MKTQKQYSNRVKWILLAIVIFSLLIALSTGVKAQTEIASGDGSRCIGDSANYSKRLFVIWDSIQRKGKRTERIAKSSKSSATRLALLKEAERLYKEVFDYALLWRLELAKEWATCKCRYPNDFTVPKP